MRAPSLKTKTLYYSQLEPKQLEFAKSVESKSNSKSKLKGKIEDTISQNIAEFSLKDIKSKAKNLTIDYIKKVLKKQTLSVSLFNKIQAIDTTKQLNQIFDLIFSIIAESMQENNKKVQLPFTELIQKQEKEQGTITVTIRSKQAKLLRIIKQEQNQGEPVSRGKTAKKLQQCQKANQNLKKQLYTLKQERQMLQKRIVSLVQQFQNRKTFYLAEIKKLTDIIKMSSFEVRNLVLQKTKEAKIMQSIRQEKNKEQKIATEKPQSQLQMIEDQGLRNYNIPINQKLVERNSYNENMGSFNGYNTQIRPLRNVTSIQFQLEKGDNYLP